jgi:hypothetical protein
MKVNELHLILHEAITETELNDLVAAVNADNVSHRAAIARNDQIRAMAQHKLIGLQLAEAERE